MSKADALIIKGFFIFLNVPNEERLKTIAIKADNLSPESFFSLVRELEDLLTVIDDSYRVGREGKGRVLRGRFTRITRDKRRRILEVTPFPSVYINKLKNLRAKVYKELNRNTVVIQSIKLGVFKRNLYLLPEGNVDKMMDVIKEADETLETIDTGIKEYLKSPLYNRVEETIDKYGVQEVSVKKTGIGRIMVNMVPAVFDPEVITPHANPEFRRYVEETKRRIVKEVIDDVRNQLIRKIRLIPKKKLTIENVQKQLQDVRETASSIGLEKIARELIDPLIKDFSTEENIKALKDKVLFENVVNSRVRALLDAI